MSLLQLSPEAVRLRRIAKACAAGELSRLEYRQARREMIDQFAAVDAAPAEPTLSRYSPDLTQRRSIPQPVAIEHQPQRRSMLLLLGLVMVLAGVAIPLWM